MFKGNIVKVGESLKKMKLLSIQSITLLFLFSFIFYQWNALSGMEKERESMTVQLEQVKEFKTKYEDANIKLEELTKENEELKKELKQQLAKFLDERGDKKIAYLTFDDGPSKNTEKILKTLKKYKVHATFFVNGNDSEFAINMYQQMTKDGHTIGNHTYSHDYSYIYQNEKNFFKDTKKLDDLLVKATGEKPTLIRFPGGSNNQISIQYGGKKLMNRLTKNANEEGYIYVDWNVDSQDASAVKVSEKKIIESVLNGSKGKQHVNILMHDAGAKESTANALPKIIEGLKKQGFEFRAMSEYSPLFQF